MKLQQEDNILEFNTSSQVLQSRQTVAKSFLRTPSGNIGLPPTPSKSRGTSIGKQWEERVYESKPTRCLNQSELFQQSSSAKELPEANGKYSLPNQNYKYFKRVEPQEKEREEKEVQKESVILNFSRSPKTCRLEKTENEVLQFSQSKTNRHRKTTEHFNHEKSTQNSQSLNSQRKRSVQLSHIGLASSTVLKFKPSPKTNLSQLIDKDTYEIDTVLPPTSQPKVMRRGSFCLEEKQQKARVISRDEGLPTNAVTRQIGGGAFSNSYPTNNPFLKFKTTQKNSLSKSKVFSNQVIGSPITFNLDRQFHSDKQLYRPKRKPLTKGDFQIGKRLGKGKYGDVYLARHRELGFICAMKIIEKELVKRENVQHQIIRQMKISQYIHNSNVTTLYGYFNDEHNVYLLLELCSGGNLFQVLKQKKRLPQSLTVTAIKQLCQGVQYLHRQNIIHRDIKPQNIIIQNGLLKLCDFGWAVYCEDRLRSTFCGTPLYVSPEVLKGDDYNQKIDIWAIGILTYELLVGRVPFRITSEADMLKIIHEEIVFPQYVTVSNLAKDFILRILDREPSNRIDIEEVLNHAFLRQECPNLFLLE